MKTNATDPAAPAGTPPESPATIRQLDIYDRERLAFTDAANAPPPEPGPAARRAKAWFTAVRCWVLSRM